MGGGTYALYKLFARILRLKAEVAAAVVNLINVKENLQRAAEINPEPTQQWLPEGVLLDALVGLGKMGGMGDQGEEKV